MPDRPALGYQPFSVVQTSRRHGGCYWPDGGVPDSRYGRVMRRIWVIRAGEGNRLVDDFLAAGVIGMGFEEVGEARELTKQAITSTLADARSTGSPAGLAGILHAFVNEVSTGDLVVTPDSPDLLIGTIEGPYRFEPQVEDVAYRHRRDVLWTHRIPAADLPPGHTALHGQRRTMNERTDSVLLEFLEGLGEPQPEEMIRTSLTRQRRVKHQRATGRRQNAAAPTAPDVVCRSCFVSRAPTQFPDGSEVCRDCTGYVATGVAREPRKDDRASPKPRAGHL